MKAFIVVIILATIIGGFVGGELSDHTFLLTGALIGGVGVATVLLGLGAFFSWQDERKKQRRGNLPPEVRNVFGHMLGSGLQRQNATSKKNASPAGTPSPKAGNSHEAFKQTIASLVSVQLLPKYSDPRQAFSSIMTNKRAAGYLFGLHDALLQERGLRNEMAAANKLMEESYQTLFGNQSGYLLFSMSRNNQDDTEFHEGRMEGGEELVSFIENMMLPLGLGRMLVLGSGQRTRTEQVDSQQGFGGQRDFNHLAFEIEKLFRRVIKESATSDFITETVTKDHIDTAISLFTYGLIVMKRAAESPAFIDTQEHTNFFSMVENHMTKNRVEVTADLFRGIPSIPGGPKPVPDAKAIRRNVQEELHAALHAVADGSMLRDMASAKSNLLQAYIAAVAFSKAQKQKDAIFEVMSDLADDYLRSDSLSAR